MEKKKKLKRKIKILKCRWKCAERATTFMEGKMEAYRIENEVLKERIKQLESQDEEEREEKSCEKCNRRAGCTINGNYGKVCKSFITREDSRNLAKALMYNFKKALFEDEGVERYYNCDECKNRNGCIAYGISMRSCVYFKTNDAGGDKKRIN